MRSGSALAIVVSMVIVLAGAGSAAASHNRVSLVSTGPTDGNGPGDSCGWGGCAAFSEDGSRVFFTTDAQLVSEDTDTQLDVYVRAGITTTLISKGPNGNGNSRTLFGAISADGTVAFFHTPDALVAADTDSQVDLYRWSGGSVSLVSIGSSGGDGPYDVCRIVSFSTTCMGTGIRHVSRDGTRVVFETEERLVPEDADGVRDAYLWDNGTVKLVSAASGPSSGSHISSSQGMSADGSNVFYTTTEQLTPGADANGAVYERVGSTVSLVTNATVNYFGKISDDGARFFFDTPESLDPTDTDGLVDVYMSQGGAITLVSARPDGTGFCCYDDAYLAGISRDGARAFFTTGEPLVAEDDDGFCVRYGIDPVTEEEYEYFVPCVDVYERAAGTTTLVSTSPALPDGDYDAGFYASSSDGLRVFFSTQEVLLADDTNNVPDVYERGAGATTRISVGPNGSGGHSAQVSTGGGRVIFRSSRQLVQADRNTFEDTYERANGRTTLLTGWRFPDYPIASTPAKDHVLFATSESVVSDDQDACPQPPYEPRLCNDLYDVRIGTPQGYPRPRGATPIHLPLVPASRQCTNATQNRTHGAPLAFGSCHPPVRESPNLTVGGDDGIAPAYSLGSLRVDVLPGAPGEADDADVRFRFGLTNVMNAADRTDYTGELQASFDVRLTDSDPGAPAFYPPATVVDFPFSFTVPCVANPDSLRGGDCALTTTAEAVLPGSIQEGARAIWGLSDVRVFDGGPDGDVDTADNSLFARQGVFIP